MEGETKGTGVKEKEGKLQKKLSTPPPFVSLTVTFFPLSFRKIEGERNESERHKGRTGDTADGEECYLVGRAEEK
jgi:hypothetical protein